jgi:hypothetical protein
MVSVFVPSCASDKIPRRQQVCNKMEEKIENAAHKNDRRSKSGIILGQLPNIISARRRVSRNMWLQRASLVAWELPQGRCGVGGMLGKPPGTW